MRCVIFELQFSSLTFSVDDGFDSSLTFSVDDGFDDDFETSTLSIFFLPCWLLKKLITVIRMYLFKR